MHPVLFTIGPFTAYGYGFMIGLGALLGIFLAMYRAKRRGLNYDLMFDVALWGLIAGMLGAKLTFLLSNMELLFTHPKEALGSDGFTVYGGLIVGILVGIWRLNRKDAPILTYLDLAVPGIALAQGFGRIGCFMAGCCYGKETDSAFSVVFPPEAIAPDGVPLIPTQLLSSAGNFLICIILLLLSNFGPEKLTKPPALTGWWLALYGFGRFIIEFFRGDARKMLWGLSSNQYVSFLFVFVGVLIIAFTYSKLKQREKSSES